MLNIAILVAFLFTSAYGSSSIKVTVTNCTKSTDVGSINTLVTNPPSPEKTDANWTVTATGIASSAITGGTFEAVAKLGPIPIFKQGGDLCAPAVVKMPEDYGTIYYSGVKCPIAKGGPLVLAMTTVVSSNTPDDTVKISVTTKDSKTDIQIICVDVVASVEDRHHTQKRSHSHDGQ
eukprot:108722_1